jgi:hypothetical protein
MLKIKNHDMTCINVFELSVLEMTKIEDRRQER